MANKQIPPFDPNAPTGSARNLQAPAAFSPPVNTVRETVMGAPQPPQPAEQVSPQPFMHPALQGNPEAIAYEAGMRARAQGVVPRAMAPQQPVQQGGIPKYAAPTPGAGPAMPPLDAEHRDGMTISAQAAEYGASQPQQVAAAAQQPGSIVDPVAVGSLGLPPGQKPPAPTPAQLGILQNDTLPAEAAQDPQYQQGQGSQVAMYQPNLALKYGVIRNGQHIPAQALQANQGGAGTNGQIGNRPMDKTLADLQALNSVQPPTGVPRTEEEAAAAAPQTRPYGEDDEGDDKRELSEEEMRAIVDKLDDYDFDALRQQMNKDMLNSPAQKKLIEGRLEELDLTDLIMRGRISQVVPIVPGKLAYTFRSMDTGDDMAIKRIIASETNTVASPGRYYLDRFSLMTMVAGLTHVNGQPLPEHLDGDGKWSDAQFMKKLDWMMVRPLHMTASVGVNHGWFEMRVRKLFVAEKVKNG